jgi:hypothetical protein
MELIERIPRQQDYSLNSYYIPTLVFHFVRSHQNPQKIKHEVHPIILSMNVTLNFNCIEGIILYVLSTSQS